MIAGAPGYLLSVPITCCITAYIMLTRSSKALRTTGRSGTCSCTLLRSESIISYALVYPTPVVIPLFDRSRENEPAPVRCHVHPDLAPASCRYLLYFRFGSPDATNAEGRRRPPGLRHAGPERGNSLAAWTPFIAILVAIPVAFLLLHLSHTSMINFIMLVGAVTAVALAPEAERTRGLSQGAKHAGMIIFDICGAGALGL